MEATGTARPDLAAELDRIEAAVAAGNDDLRALGFWGVVAQVKADPALVQTYAGRIGTIDRASFLARVKRRVPVWVGNLILLVEAFIGAAAVWFALRPATTPAWAGFLLIVAAGLWTVSFHCPVHWIVGKAVGIRFTDYFLGGPPPPRPGLKSDYASYLRADPRARAWMHASGALGTKLAPFLALAFWPASGAPWWSAAALIAIGALVIATDILFSVKSSDWKRFRREMAVARCVVRGALDRRSDAGILPSNHRGARVPTGLRGRITFRRPARPEPGNAGGGSDAGSRSAVAGRVRRDHGNAGWGTRAP